MKTVAIICEYNPFHNGHLYQIEQIRRELGDDTVILALMSGNYTQRGELAVADKSLRAKWAVMSGVNLCLELPFPYSISSAEFFAKSAVHILNSIGRVDYLSFGSECGDLSLLVKIARCMLTEEYESLLSELIADKKNAKRGYPELSYEAILRVLGELDSIPDTTPNNILALEYIKALIRTESSIKPHTVKREGDYNSEIPHDRSILSATAARKIFSEAPDELCPYLPQPVIDGLMAAKRDGLAPTDASRLSTAVISYLRLHPQSVSSDIHDAGGGLYNRLLAKSLESSNIDTLVLKTETRHYTTARIRRAIWYSFFGVTSSDMNEPPMYTQLLAMDQAGRRELKRIKKHSDFPILTKPSRISELNDLARKQKMKSDLADSIFRLAMPAAPEENLTLTFTPYVKDDE